MPTRPQPRWAGPTNLVPGAARCHRHRFEYRPPPRRRRPSRCAPSLPTVSTRSESSACPSTSSDDRRAIDDAGRRPLVDASSRSALESRRGPGRRGDAGLRHERHPRGAQRPEPSLTEVGAHSRGRPPGAVRGGRGPTDLPRRPPVARLVGRAPSCSLDIGGGSLELATSAWTRTPTPPSPCRSVRAGSPATHPRRWRSTPRRGGARGAHAPSVPRSGRGACGLILRAQAADTRGRDLQDLPFAGPP
jgi:hypothetical protein